MKYFFLLTSVFLASCSSYNEAFDCEPGIGVGCKSLGEVNRMVDRGELPLSKEDIEEAVGPIPHVTLGQGLRIWIALQESSPCSIS